MSRVSVKVATEARFLSGHGRRQEALERQRRERQALADAHRHAISMIDESAPTTVVLSETPTPDTRHVIIGEIPEWMIDIPSDLYENWSILARPAGQRCIVFCQYGRTSLRSVENRFIRSCTTALPNGGPNSGASAQATVLEGILQDSFLFIIDVISWKGYHLVNSARQFRQYWLQTKAAEHDLTSSNGNYDLVVVPLLAAECSPESITAAYRGFHESSNAQSDGMQFYHDEALYTTGCTPLTLLWKDARCSPYYIEGSSDELQQVCLRCDSSGALVTEDGIVLGHLDPSSLGGEVSKLQKFTIDGVDLSSHRPSVINLQRIGSFPAGKVIAHTWSKIVFQYGARQGRNFVEITDLLGRRSL